VNVRSTRAARSKALLGGVTALAAAIACGCSSSTPAGTGAKCVTAASCPEGDVPSYQTEIAPILQAACIPCHGPSGTAGFYETTYAEVSSQAGSMLSQVAVCAMPPLNGPAMSDAQRVALTAWLRCGAPDN
jgi:uncharacterized membrane protein